MIKFALVILFFFSSAFADSPCPPQWDLMPVVYQDRICPLGASARLWLEEVYHRDTLMPEHRVLLNLKKGSAVEFLWNVSTLDDQNLECVPLFWIGDDAMKAFLGLDTTLDRFTFQDLKRVFEDTLQLNLKVLEQLILDAFIKIKGNTALDPGQKILLRIINADIECRLWGKNLIVTKAPSIVPWHYLSASSAYAIDLPAGLSIESWSGGLHSLIGHFLQYKNFLLSKTVIESLFLSPFVSDSAEKISSLHAWIFSSTFCSLPPAEIATTIAQFFNDYKGILKQKNNRYPTLLQLRTENLLTGLRLWIPIAALYFLGAIFFIGGNRILRVLGWSLLGSAFILHSYVLMLKMIVFASLPISTLFDASLFAAWLATLFGFSLFLIFKRNRFFLFSVLGSACFFILSSIWNAQAVPIDFLFNREVWLFFHELASAAGFFLLVLGGIIAHVALISSRKFSFSLQHCVYWGTFCIGIGILIGQLWIHSGSASILEWGSRESWALMTLCFYSMLIYLDNAKLKNLFTGGGCVGMLMLGWGFRKHPILLSLGFEKAIGFFYPGCILLELFFIAAISIESWTLLSEKKKRARFKDETRYCDQKDQG